jgi:glycosyltransferase involved in cell wall biosynthesis
MTSIHGTDSTPVLSLVVPMLNEAEMVPIIVARLTEVLSKIGETFEIIFVNDGSTDDTATLLDDAHARDPRIKVLHLSRNFGKELALTAGFDHALGDAVVAIDADLQDPPELIEEFVRLWREGYDVVYGQRTERKTDTPVKRMTANWFYAVMRRLFRIDIPPSAGDFRLMDRQAVDALNRLRERNRFMKGLFAWVGYKQIAVPYSRPPRAAGTTKFSYWRLWNFALDGITSQSTVPLRIAGYLGLLTAVFAVAYGIYLIAKTLILGVDVPGFASIMVAVLFLGGVQLMVLGVIGEYLGRVFEETKHRPIYLVRSSKGVDVLQSNAERPRLSA